MRFLMLRNVALGFLIAAMSVSVAMAQTIPGSPLTVMQPPPSILLSQANTWSGQQTFSSPIILTGTIPTVTGTGTPTITAGSTDSAGEITSGTTATSIVITFSSVKTNAPFCTVTPQTQLVSFAYTISTSAITITQTATSGEKIDYVCFQH